MRITLVGYMSSGKTTIGKKLAYALNFDFIDLDAEIEARYHISITDFFAKYDENAFRKAEQKALHEHLHKDDIVLSTGGGTACFFDNMQYINKHSHSIYLQLPDEELIRRITASKKTRPVLRNYKGTDIVNHIQTQIKQREVYYLQAHQIVSGIQTDIEEILRSIAQ